MEQIIIQILTKIETGKKEKRIAPSHATMYEVMRELKNMLHSELETMQQNGVVKIGRAVNDEYVTLIGK